MLPVSPSIFVGAMSNFTVMSYNVEWMANLFDGAAVVANAESQARVQAIADVITRENPDLLALCEAANNPPRHTRPSSRPFLPRSNDQVASSSARLRQAAVSEVTG